MEEVFQVVNNKTQKFHNIMYTFLSVLVWYFIAQVFITFRRVFKALLKYLSVKNVFKF